jgi:hypothetical protein
MNLSIWLQDLYENHSHQKNDNKTGGYEMLSFIPKLKKTDDTSEELLTMRKVWIKTDLYVFSDFTNDSKSFKTRGFQYKDIVVIRKVRGIAIAPTDRARFTLFYPQETLMIQECSLPVRHVIHLLKYLKNNSDLESKQNFLLIFTSRIVRINYPFADFIAQGMALFQETDFEWLMRF